MDKAHRGLAALVAVLILVALGTTAFGSRMLGMGMIWSLPGAGAPAEGMDSGAWMGLGWLTMLAFWGAVIAGVVLLVRALMRPRRDAAGTSALEILRHRYEAGEITREQYEHACKALRAHPATRRRGA